MATNYDMMFLRVLMRDGGADKSRAMRCLQVIDEQGQQGRTVNAMQVAVRMGLVDEALARRVDAATRQELQKSGVDAGSSAGQSSRRAQRPGTGRVKKPGTGRVKREGSSRRQGARSTGRVPRPSSARSSGQIASPRGPSGDIQASSTRVPRPAKGSEDYFALEGMDGFELGPMISKGRVGNTFLGRYGENGTQVIVKTLSPKFQKHPKLLHQVLGAIAPWRAIQHPRLTQVLRIGESHGRNVVILQRAPGRTLQEILKEQGALEPSKSLRAVYDVAKALAAAQEKGLYHGDIRPRKTFYDGKHYMLGDPGMARAACLAAGFGQFGMAFGHPAYLAPEVIQEHLPKPTATTDVYALGIFFYELLCGRLPFTGDVPAVLEKQFGAPLPPPPTTVKFSRSVAGLLLKMTAKSPSDRIPDSRAVVKAINLLLQGKMQKHAARTGRPLTDITASQSIAVEEFDPSADAVSLDAWDAESKKQARPSTKWDKNKIQQAPKVGPSEWHPGLEEQEDDATGLMAAIRDASAHTEDKKKGKGTKPARRKVGAARNEPLRYGVKDPELSTQPIEGMRSQFLLSAVGIVAVVIACLGMAVYGFVKPDEPAEVKRELPNDYKKLIAEQEAFAKKVKEEVASYGAKAEELIEGGSFRDAVKLHKSHFSSDEVRKAEAAQAMVRTIELKAQGAAWEKVEQERQAVDKLIRSKDLGRAKKLVDRMRSWVLHPDIPRQLSQRIREVQEEEFREVRELKLRKPLKDLKAARGKLAKMVHGTVRLFKGGGVLVRSKAGSGLEKDLVRLKGKPQVFQKAQLPVRGRPVGLHIKAGSQPVLLGTRLPLLRLLDVSLKVVLTERPNVQSRVALLIGVGSKRHSGTGVAYGIVPMRLRKYGQLDMIHSNMEMPNLPKNRVVDTRLKIFMQGKDPWFRGFTQVGEELEAGPAMKLPHRASGFVGIYLERAEIYVLSLQIQGLINPRSVE